jgi:hypothetical protein
LRTNIRARFQRALDRIGDLGMRIDRRLGVELRCGRRWRLGLGILRAHSSNASGANGSRGSGLKPGKPFEVRMGLGDDTASLLVGYLHRAASVICASMARNSLSARSSSRSMRGLLTTRSTCNATNGGYLLPINTGNVSWERRSRTTTRLFGWGYFRYLALSKATSLTSR